jgi:polyisoprenyl-teichoic acid--peptidoglycan teichoic acid transferase
VGTLATVVVLGLVAAAGAAWGLWSFSQLRRESLNLAEASDTEPQNYLVIGSDSREGVAKGAGSGALLGKDAPPGRRSDSIAVMRVDPSKQRVDMLSIPRDLWLPIAGTGKEQRINTAYGKSTQTLVDTIQQNLGIPINHFVEVDFVGFQDLIETMGGVPMYFDHPVRDRNSGLRVDKKGCAVLDGYQGLAFARSRHLEWNNGTRWVSDPTGDLGRMTRQQLLARAALAKMRKLGLNDIGKVKGLVDAGVDNVKLDDAIGVSEILDLSSHFSDFDPQRLQTHSLPVVAHTTDGGAAVVLLDTPAAQPTLDIFRGTTSSSVTTTTVAPPAASDVTVTVTNHTTKQGEARRVSFVLAGGGFGVGTVDSSADATATTVVRYPKGSKAMGELVAAWIGPSPELKEDKALAPGTVVVDIGADFSSVSEPAGTTGAPSTSAPTGSSSTGSSSTASTGSSGSTPTTTTTTEPGWTPGTPPAGVTCA